MKDNKKFGRPYITGKPKTINLSVRFDEKEHQELKEKAEKNNMKIAEYIRYLIKKDK